ncbi:hypothetical protein A8F94_20935 [Bacillus sp. FJAT-27225]|uniref:DUF2529 family protein n=1 Tax=Bacillus sp. FJAT-27225 TaxID=1743144 RepID=UPI00080C2B11|nr:DUF2529 family protein [Bacillus sp. FJAT-27225]OCA82371.1 hypothetical protein A8F94_20935 [Bacillus sp. FJAT-27225]
MLKMFSTQLTGLLGRIYSKQEENFEDAARLLAQAAAGQGKIYIYGAEEMASVGLEAIKGAEPLKRAAIWEPSSPPALTPADRAIIVSRFSSDPDLVKVAGILHQEGVPYVSICTKEEEKDSTLTDLADVHIDLFLKKGLLPDETGGRYGYPAPIAALYVYYALKFTIDEMLAEYEELL